ncbi:hypothetical protein QVD17_00903 [Tagetes erecta]|uniref:Senescence regulator n=1 Tax=Tagetes erecta TaxID=13708 RepID=A0AAD8L8R8_TARER|nr:hypothetical protein QVD17_00903 [Tagetes erecta]
MATSKTYYSRSNFRYLSGEPQPHVTTDSIFELDESDVWNVATSSPEFRKTVRISKKTSSSSAVVKRAEIGGTASSLPVNVPDWSKILKEDYNQNRRRNKYNDGDDDYSYDSDEFESGDGRIPPHEMVARQLARTRIVSCSVHEGIGRTLKGRDLSRVRNAIWEKTGFQD